MENKDIVIVGQQPWDTELGSNCKNIALEFSKQNRVLYINSPLDRITAMGQRSDARVKKRMTIIKGREPLLEKIKDNLWVLYPDCLVESVNWIPIQYLFNRINKRNGKKFAASILRAMTRLSFRNIYLFNDNELIKCFYLTEFLHPVMGIYYSRDYILATAYWKKHGKRLEPLVIAKNNLCVANSPYLADYCRQYNPNSADVGQGCDFQIFDQPSATARPLELTAIDKPIVGYVGALISARLDIELILFLADQLPDFQFVLVGPEDTSFEKSDLHKKSNVLFTGHKAMEILPAYIASFDVCLNPQAVNELTIGNYPRKIDEYLFMGKPVVATRTKTMEMFNDHVYLFNTKMEALLLITLAIKENSIQRQQSRRNFAASHSWENSVLRIYESIKLTGS